MLFYFTLCEITECRSLFAQLFSFFVYFGDITAVFSPFLLQIILPLLCLRLAWCFNRRHVLYIFLFSALIVSSLSLFLLVSTKLSLSTCWVTHKCIVISSYLIKRYHTISQTKSQCVFDLSVRFRLHHSFPKHGPGILVWKLVSQCWASKIA